MAGEAILFTPQPSYRPELCLWARCTRAGCTIAPGVVAHKVDEQLQLRALLLVEKIL
jgi:hypothetical protein